jgi:hypothetical protein
VQCCYSQSEPEQFEAGLLEAKYGALIVFNGTKHSYTVKVVAKDVKPSENPGFLTADNKVLQALSVSIPVKAKLNYDSISIQDQKALLSGHKSYELNYISKTLGKTLAADTQYVFLNDKLFLRWSYNMPVESGNIKKQIYLTTICFSDILILNSPVDKDENENMNFLNNVASTIQLNNVPLDLDKLYYDLKK